MNRSLEAVKSVIPWRARVALRKVHGATVFRRAMQALMADPLAAARDPGRLLPDLIYGWGNESWSGQVAYISACMQAVAAAKLPVLECGSGLTTIVLGAICQRTGNTLWSLEHMPEWADRVSRLTDRHGIAAAHVVPAPLRSYGDYDWYAPSLHALPPTFGVVICDGPPASTRGGRYGLSAMRERLAEGCLILLDDAERAGERSVAQRWQGELPATPRMLASDKPYIELIVGAAIAQQPNPL